MTATKASPDGNMDAGKLYDVSKEQAKNLVENGYAEYIEKPMEQATAPQEPENAMEEEMANQKEWVAKHIGGGWYDYKGNSYRKKDLPEGAVVNGDN